jgi:DUF1365 family protein
MLLPSRSSSCLYKARVMHNRLAPKQHYFYYDIFMFYLDLDELDQLSSRLRWMSRNSFNLFNFRDKDHLQFPRENPDTSKNIKEQISIYLRENGIEIGSGRIMLLTNLCTLGYQFNPVSFYFCFDEDDKPLCSVVEICNTYREMKPYFLGEAKFDKERFHLNTAKDFYVSPFIDMDTSFDFDIGIPDEKLQIHIDDYDKEGNRFFISTLTGKQQPLTDVNLLYYFFSFPMITLKVITLIHWQAFKLWIKKIKYHKKADNQELQRNVYRPYQP